MQKRLAALSRANTRVRARGLRSDGYWEEVEVGKRWRLARGGGWQEVEVGKRLLSSEISMLVIELRFFFYGLFHEKSTFSSLASSGSIRRNFAISRINWLGNKFFFFLFFVFSFSFFYGFHRSKSLTLNLKFGFFHFHCLFLGE